MKLATFVLNNNTKEQKIGTYKKENKIIDLQQLHIHLKSIPSSLFTDMLAFLNDFDNAKNLVNEIISQSIDEYEYDQSQIKLLAPVTRPLSIRDFSLYEQHMINCGIQFTRMRGEDPDLKDPDSFKPDVNWYKLPIYYKGNPATVGGTETEIEFPDGENFRDYECELGLYIGKKGKDIKKENALDYIAGFTIFNDFTARNHQSEEMNGYVTFGPAKGKDFDTGNVMGPCMVTRDEFDHTNATMIVRVNGEERTRNNSGTYNHSIETLIERVSKGETIYPGDFIGLGTVGWGSGIEHGKPLLPGDIVELEIEGIGTIKNKIKK